MHTMITPPRSLALIALGLIVASCGKQEPAAPAAVAPVKPTVSSSKAPLPIPEDNDTLDAAIVDFKRRHSFSTPIDLLKLPEFTTKLGEQLKQIAADKKLQDDVNKSVHTMGLLRGLEGPVGSNKLDLKFESYTPARTDRFLAAVLDGRGKTLVDWVNNEIGEASIEFSLNPDLDRASNGMAVEHNPTPPAPTKP
jgi:hypothetical protein